MSFLQRSFFFLISITLARHSSHAQLLPEILTPQETESIAVPVIHVYESQSKKVALGQQCWSSLVSERTLQIRAVNSQSFLRRHLAAGTGAAMGATAGGWLLHQHAAPTVASQWMFPSLVVTGLAGYWAGPVGVIGALAGGTLADKYGQHDRLKILGGGLAGAIAGKALWDAVFPDKVPADIKDEIAADVFVRETLCEPQNVPAYSYSNYRITYEFNGIPYSAEVNFNPGEAVMVNKDTGAVLAPAPRY